MGKTRIEELCYELYGSWNQHDSWQRYAMIRELRELMKQPKGGSDHFERSGDEKQLPVIDDETDLLGTGTIVDPTTEICEKLVHKAVLEEKSTSQFQVPIANSEIVRISEPGKVDLGLGNEESVELNENLEQEGDQKNAKKETDVVGEVERDQKMIRDAKICCAHKVFGKMSPHETLGIKKKTKWFKSWRFKFKQRKQQKDKLRSAHQLIHRGNVVYKYLGSSAKVALMKKNKLSITWPMLKDDCFIEDDQVSHETIPLWLLVRFKFWKFKFMNRKRQKMMREHGYSSYLTLKSDVGEDDEMFTGAKAVSMRFLLGIMLGITESDASTSLSQGQQAVVEKVVMMNEWLQPSLVIEQMMRDKKIKFTKQWMFKFKMNFKPARINHTLHQEKKPSKSPKSWMFKYKFDEEDQGILQSRTGWTQEEPAVIRFLLRRHLYLNLDCEAPELVDIYAWCILSPLFILIDPGTHNFMNPKIAEKLGCLVESAGLTRVSVADGNKLGVKGRVDGFKWNFQSTPFEADVRLISLGGRDVVLGVQWLETLGPITWDFKKLEMSFMIGKQQVLLHGIKPGSVREVTAQKINKLQDDQVQIAMICVHAFSEEGEAEINSLRPHLDTKDFGTSDQGIRKIVFVGADRETNNNHPTLRFLMNTKQSCLSLRANRVWDPGRLDFMNFSVVLKLKGHCRRRPSFIGVPITSLTYHLFQTLRSRFLQRREI